MLGKAAQNPNHIQGKFLSPLNTEILHDSPKNKKFKIKYSCEITEIN